MNTDKLNITEKTTDGETRAIETNHIEIIAEIKDALIRTGNTGWVDPAIPDGINKLGKIIETIKTACLDMDHTTMAGALYYNANIHVDLVLGQMLDRFLNPEKSRDISKTAEDSLAILSTVQAVFDSTQSRQIDDVACHHVIAQTSELRRVTLDRHLHPGLIPEDPKSASMLQINGKFDAILKKFSEI